MITLEVSLLLRPDMCKYTVQIHIHEGYIKRMKNIPAPFLKINYQRGVFLPLLLHDQAQAREKDKNERPPNNDCVHHTLSQQ